MYKLLLLICSFLFVSLCKAQQNHGYLFKHLTTAQGLLSDLRLVMAEDRFGRLWIGSDEGINIFDGFQLSSYTVADDFGLTDNNIQNIFCDKQGTIWVANSLGIQYKREQDNKFYSLETSKKLSVTFMGETVNGDLLLVTKKEILQVNKAFAVSNLETLSTLFKQYNAPSCFEKFKDNEWFIGFKDKIILVNVSTQETIATLPYAKAWCTSYVNDSTALMGSFTKDTIVLMNIKTGSWECINNWASSSKNIAGFAGSICKVGENKFAIGCRYYGVYVVDVALKTNIQLTHIPEDVYTIKSSYVRRIFLNKANTLFVHSKAISYCSFNKPLFNTEKTVISEKGEKYDGGFNAFVQQKNNNLWIGSNSHLVLWNSGTNSSKYFSYYNPTEGALKYKTIRTVVKDAKDRIWVGTFGGGIGMLQSNGLFQQFRKNSQDSLHSLPSDEVSNISTDNSNNFLISCNNGFAFFNPLTTKMQTFFSHSILKPISKTHTYSFYEDVKNNWWFAQATGLYQFNTSSNKLYTIKLPKEVTDFQINCIATDSLGTLYAGGVNGLYIVDEANHCVKKWLSKKDGLISNIIQAMVCDKQGLVWIVGNIGLASYNPTSGALRVFDASDGLLQGNHPLNSAYLTKDGEIFISNIDGFNHFYPNKIVYKTKVLNVVVSALIINDSIISNPSFSNESFAYNKNNFSFTYLVVDFNLGPTIQYRYKLIGYDTTYIYAGKQRTARYTNLPAGNFTFIVEATSNGKDWIASKQVISFNISKAFWATWWFRAIMLSLIICFGIFYFKRRIKIISTTAQLKSDFEIKLNELENSALRTQMNPHFIFNSLNTINSFINRNEGIKANQYISKFSKLIRLILDHSREKKILLQDELDVLDLYVQIERIRFDNKFNYELDIQENIDSSGLEIPPLILQPFIENAILHGLLPLEKDGLLQVSIKKEKNVLLCIIDDNGVGRQVAAKQKHMSPGKRKSHGMEITMKRIELFNRENNIEESVQIIDKVDSLGNALGTTVKISLAWHERF